MHRNFERSLSAVLKHEGGYVDHPKDPGGATNLGITIGTAKSNRMDLDRDGDVDKADVRLIKASDAGPVYKTRYWDTVSGDDLPDGVDLAVFDYAVNSGPARAAITLQEILSVAPDGKIGPLTVQAANGLGSAYIVNELCDDRLAFLKRLSTFATFGKGWAARVKDVRALSLGLASASPTQPAPTPPPPAPTPVTPRAAVATGRGTTGWLILAAVVAAALVIAAFTIKF